MQEQLWATRHRLMSASTRVWSLAGDPNARAKAREMAPKVLAAAANGIRTALPKAQTKPERPRGEWYLAGITCKAPGLTKTVYIRIHEITAMMKWNFDPGFAEQTIHLPRLGLVVTTYHIPNDVLPPARAAIRKAVNQAVMPLLKLEGAAVRRRERPLPTAAKNLDARIRKLIAQLGSDEHKQREAAHKELIQIGRPVIRALQAAIDGKDASATKSGKERTAVQKLLDLLDLPWQTKPTAKQLDQAAASILPNADQAVETIMKAYNATHNKAFRHRTVHIFERMGTDKARIALLDIALGRTRDKLSSSHGWAARAYLETMNDKADARKLLASDNPQVLNSALLVLKGRPVDKVLLKRIGQIVRRKPSMTSGWHSFRFAAAGVLSSDKRAVLLTRGSICSWRCCPTWRRCPRRTR